MHHATPKMLRCLILIEIISGLTSGIVDIMLEHSLPSEMRQYIARADAAGMTSVQLAGYGLGIILLGGLIVSWIGLWTLWQPARTVYTACWLLGLPLYLLLEPAYYYTPVGLMLNEYSVLSAGVILGLLYFSGLAVNFSRTNAEPGTGPTSDHPV